MKLCIFVNPYSFTIFAVGGYKGGLPLNPLPQYNIVTKAEKLIFTIFAYSCRELLVVYPYSSLNIAHSFVIRTYRHYSYLNIVIISLIYLNL